MSRLSKFLSTVLCVGCLSGPAAAATLPDVSFGKFSAESRKAQLQGLTNIRVEDFETFTKGELKDTLKTRVGTFDTLGGTGSGSTVSGTKGNSGKGLYLRDRRTHGRDNTTVGGDLFLDSNDTRGMTWNISGVGLFDRVFFNLSDLGDAGGKFSLITSEHTIYRSDKRRKNGMIDMVMLSFPTTVSYLTLNFQHHKGNDGFSIDDAGVALSSSNPVPAPSPVPLPGGFALLAAGGASFLALKYRKRKPAA
jgi:hypothetical protein